MSIPKVEYTRLQRQAQAYRQLAARLFESLAQDPIAEVVEDFKATNLYSDEFLVDLEAGLRRSSYASRHEI